MFKKTNRLATTVQSVTKELDGAAEDCLELLLVVLVVVLDEVLVVVLVVVVVVEGGAVIFPSIKGFVIAVVQ